MNHEHKDVERKEFLIPTIIGALLVITGPPLFIQLIATLIEAFNLTP